MALTESIGQRIFKEISASFIYTQLERQGVVVGYSHYSLGVKFYFVVAVHFEIVVLCIDSSVVVLTQLQRGK